MLMNNSRVSSLELYQYPPETFRFHILNYCLYLHPESSVRELMQVNNIHFRFFLDGFYFCLTGLKKRLYSDVYHFSASQYVEIYRSIEKQIYNLMEQYNWCGDIFLVWKTDEKQIGILMSPLSDAQLDANQIAKRIDTLVQHAYEQTIFNGRTQHRNVTALSSLQRGYNGIRIGYDQARELYNLSFFHMDSRILTKEEIHLHRNAADYPVILNACFALQNYIDAGNTQQALHSLRALFLDTIRNSSSLVLCDDALSFIKSMLHVRCRVYNIVSESSLETLCARTSYHKVEECVDTLIPVIRLLCAAVQKQGAFSKPVLSAIYYIKMHFSEYLVLTDIAHYANTNASYLSSRFKEETGYSVRNYINKVRLENAQNILLKNQDTLSVIAQQVGFEDVRYFTRLFKQFSGCTPTEYRRSSAQSLYIKDED